MDVTIGDLPRRIRRDPVSISTDNLFAPSSSHQARRCFKSSIYSRTVRSDPRNVVGRRGRKAGLSEASNDYPRVVAVLSDGKTRVIVCYAASNGSCSSGRASNGTRDPFCCTKEALIRGCGGSTPDLDALPDRIGD
jgi:hypothetical protein